MDDYFEKGFALVLADILSLITISSCLVCKIPQIRMICVLESATGISLLAILLELSSYTTTMSYNFVRGYSYLSYLEYPVLLVQDYVLLYCVLKYSNLLNTRTFMYSLLYVTIAGLFLAQIIPPIVLTMMLPLCTPIGATSKIIQLMAILRTKDSSSVSQITWGISVFTNLTRIYTISVESMDIMLLGNFGISCLLSSSVLVAAKYYHKEKSYKKLD